MKKLVTIVLSLLIAIAAIVAVYRFTSRGNVPEDLTADEQTLLVLSQNDCFVCHTNKGDLPFSARLPLVGKMQMDHIQKATLFIDLETVASDIANADEVSIAKIDHAVSYGTMPLPEYKLVHWGTGLNGKEKSAIAKWILEKRGSAEFIQPIPSSVDVDPDKASLGERMFNDARISLDGTITCATCHVLEKGGADHEDERVSEGIDGLHGGVNAPTVYNAVFNIRQFWNGRAADLREQAEGPATNPVEMGDQTWEDIVARLSLDKNLVKEFETLYPGQGMTGYTITDAIAEFEKTLITPDSKFDQYLKGNADALSQDQLEGYELFKKLACATCHTGVNMGGKSFEYFSIYGDWIEDRDPSIEIVIDDEGLKSFTGKDSDLFKFKVPTLRNIALTAPYFHDGTVQTLDDAVKAMAKYELGKELSDNDVKSIVAFMNTLSGHNPHMQ